MVRHEIISWAKLPVPEVFYNFCSVLCGSVPKCVASFFVLSAIEKCKLFVIKN